MVLRDYWNSVGRFICRHCVVILLCVSFADALIWLIGMWFADAQNLGFFLIFVASAYLLRQEWIKSSSELKANMASWQIAIVGLAISAEIANVFSLKYSILSAVVFVVLFATLFLKRHVRIAILFLLSIPASFYINAIFGPLFRKVYAEIVFRFVSIFTPRTLLDGTIIRTGTSYINIDTGCSGILTLYHILALGVFLSVILKLKVKATIVITIVAWLIYCTFNAVQLLALAYMGNVLLYQNVQFIHKITANLVSIIGLCAVPVIYILLKSQFVKTPSQFVGKSKRSKSSFGNRYVFILLIVLIVAKVVAYAGLNNNKLRILSVGSECIPSKFHSANVSKNLLNILREAEFSSYAYFEDGSGHSILVGQTNSVNILANAGKIEVAKGKAVDSIRTEILDTGAKVRRISNTDDSMAYYILADNSKTYLEFNFADLIIRPTNGRFIYLSASDNNFDIGSAIRNIHPSCLQGI